MSYHWALTALLLMAVASWGSPAQKPAKQFLNPEGVANPRGLGYTQVVTSRPGRMVFISGQGGAPSPGAPLPADFASQATNVFENIGRCLRAAGAGFDDIVKINYFISDMANTGELRRIRAKYLNQNNPPAATLVQVTLAKDLLLEVEAVAIVPE
jgi:enamine deaminase RidA (YjgF/YER057c/UK114 family)